MARKKLESYLSPISRKVRGKGKSGVCKDTARCYVVTAGVRREIYLGPWGSQEAQDKYNRIAAEFYGSGSLSEDVQQPDKISLAFLFSQFLEHCDRKLKDPNDKFDNRELNHFETIIKHVLQIYADLPIKDFNCSAYRNVRQYLCSIAPEVEWRENGVYKSGKNPDGTSRVGQPKKIMTKRPWSKNYVLQLMDYLRKILHWGVAHDMVDYAIVEKFKFVEPLKTDIEELEPRQEVPDVVIQKTLPFMTPTIRDMVIIQRGNGLRPNEICYLRVGNIDRSGEVWKTTKKGKTTWKTGIPLIICFSADERAILERRIANKGADEYVFTPAEAQQERWAISAQNRKTKVQPSQQVRKNKKTSEQKLARFRESYTPESYGRAIQYAQKAAAKAGVRIPHWTPYQIRHTAVTAVAYEHDRQTAAYLAGHTCLSTTSRYAHEAGKVKEDLAKERKPYWPMEESPCKKPPLTDPK